MPTHASLPAALSPLTARHIIERLGSAGVPPIDGIEALNVGNDSILRLLRSEYFETLLTAGSAFKLVEAHYGGGKTHFLRLVQSVAWSYGFAVALVELSPQECPYDNPLAVYVQVARRIRLRPTSPLEAGATGVPELVRRTVDERLVEAAADQPDSKPDDHRWTLQRDLRRALRRAPCESPSFRSAIATLADAILGEDDRTERLIEAWLLGESVPLADLRPLGINEQITRTNGFTMLRSLTQMICALGHAGTGLLFDEVDRTLSVSSRRTEAIGDNLRQVIDLCGASRLPRTLFLYAVPPEFMRQIVPDYPALEQRLRSPVPFSERSPQAPVIPLDQLDLPPQPLLEAIAERIVPIFELARQADLDPAVQEHNARQLAAACVAREFDVNHRRLFVKAWVATLQVQALEGDHLLTDDAVRALIEGEHAALSKAAPTDTFADF